MRFDLRRSRCIERSRQVYELGVRPQPIHAKPSREIAAADFQVGRTLSKTIQAFLELPALNCPISRTFFI